MKAVKIGLYARVSSEKQAQEKTIDSQISAILDHAISENVHIDPNLYFIDNGVSGTGLERPGLDKMRDKALNHELSMVYILSPDRLSRKSSHQMLLIEEMKRLGVQFNFVNRKIGDSPEDQMLLQMQGIIAEYEREKILERSRRGKLFAAKKGKVNALGGAPYGYFYQKASENKDAFYLIHPDESDVVKEAYDLFCNKGLSIREISKIFTKKQYQTRTGKVTWDRTVIWGMLRNPAYMGQAGFRKTKRVRRLRKTKASHDRKATSPQELSSTRDRPKEDWISISVPAIISERLFSLAQKRLTDNIKFSPRNNIKNHYLLTGLLRCASCGYSIYGKPASKVKKNRLYYRCVGQDSNRWESGRICNGHPVRTEVIDDLVWESVRCLLMNPEAMIAEFERRSHPEKDGIDALIEQKQTEIKRFSNERSRLIDLFQSGFVEKSEIEVRLKSAATQLEQLAGELDYLEREKHEQKKMLSLIQDLSGFSESLKKNLDTCSLEDRKKVVRLLVEEVQVDTISEKIKIKHIVPMEPKKCHLCWGTLGAATWETSESTFMLPRLPQALKARPSAKLVKAALLNADGLTKLNFMFTPSYFLGI